MSLVLVWGVTSAATASVFDGCSKTKNLNGQSLYKCSFKGGKKYINVLHVKGGMVETAYYHGLFLGREIKEGLYKGVVEKKTQALQQLDKQERKLFEKINKCLLGHYKSNTSSEFINMNRNLYRGIDDSGVQGVTEKEFLEVNYLVESSIFFDSLERTMSKDKGKATRKIISMCGPQFIVDGIWGVLKKIAKPFASMKFGCTGAAATGPITKDGDLVLGRNFDTGLLGSFEKHPLILIQDMPDGTRVVGMASAGLHYAGGISGFNSHGLVASLHELQTEAVAYKHVQGKFRRRRSRVRQKTDVAPFLVHKILMQAKNLDEAIALAKKTRGLGAWTILIADQRSGEIASIEIAGNTVEVARKTRDSFMGQTNHYFGKKTREKGYTYSINKDLETHGRMMLVEQTLSEKRGDVGHQTIIDLLSGHTDWYVGPRSFGRTTTKVYTSVTHVMKPKSGEFWMSLGDEYPTTSTPFIGFRVVNKQQPFEFIGTTLAKRPYDLPNWYRSMGYYVKAYMKQKYSRVNPAKGQPSVNQSVVQLLSKGIELAQLDAVEEMPYYFMRARVYTDMSSQAFTASNAASVKEYILKAQKDWLFILAAERSGKMKLHPYQRALSNMWLYRTEEVLESIGQRGLVNLRRHKNEAWSEFSKISNQFRDHYDFAKLLKTFLKPVDFQVIDSEAIHFGTVE